jgi:hypothetical protein
VSVMAQEQKSKPGWRERRREKKHEKRLRKIHKKGVSAGPTPLNPVWAGGLGAASSAAGYPPLVVPRGAARARVAQWGGIVAA